MDTRSTSPHCFACKFLALTCSSVALFFFVLLFFSFQVSVSLFQSKKDRNGGAGAKQFTNIFVKASNTHLALAEAQTGLVSTVAHFLFFLFFFSCVESCW